MTEGWELIRKHMVTGDTEPVSRYLGCEHRILDVMVPAVSKPAHGDIPEPAPKARKKQKKREFPMHSFFSFSRPPRRLD